MFMGKMYKAVIFPCLLGWHWQDVDWCEHINYLGFNCLSGKCVKFAT